MSREEEIGTLIVVVLKARNLNDKHFYKQDAYATIILNGVKKRTKVDVKGGQHPEWDEEIRFPIMRNQSTKFRKLEAQCWSKEHRDDDLLGEGSVDISETLNTGEFDEWVPLQVDGVARGDIYLEMTFYSNRPPPAASQPAAPKNNLGVPINSNLLQRRPSKLPPSERLSRPSRVPTHPNTYTAASNHDQIPIGSQKTPPKTPPKDVHSALPPVSESYLPLPGTLRPGSNPTRPQSYNSPSTSQLQPVGAPQRIPSILRPANTKAAPEPVLPSTAIPDSTSGYPRHSNGSVPYRPGPGPEFPSHSHYTSPTPYPPSTTNRVPSPSVPNETWGGGGGQYAVSSYQREAPPMSFSFPVPDVVTSPSSPPPQPIAPYQRQRTSSYVDPRNLNSSSPAPPAPAPPYNYQIPDLPRTDSELPDPYLIARYQTPLPLPPGAESYLHSSATPPLHQRPAFNRTPSQSTPPPSPPYHSRPDPPSLPVPTHTPPVRQPTPVDEGRLKVLRQAEVEAARRKEQEERDAELARQLDRDLATEQERPPPRPPKTPSPVREDPAAVARRIKAEEEARRREQEEKDLELARQLDLELNLASTSTDSPRMPGGI